MNLNWVSTENDVFFVIPKRDQVDLRHLCRIYLSKVVPNFSWHKLNSALKPFLPDFDTGFFVFIFFHSSFFSLFFTRCS